VLRGLIGKVTGPFGQDQVELEAAYASPAPWLRANFALTIDGAVELGGVSGAIGGPVDRELFVAMRSLCDAVLVGAGTARAETYGPAWLRADARLRRRARGQTEMPTVVVVTGSGRLDPGARLFVERRNGQPAPPRPIVVTSDAADPGAVAALGEVATVLSCGDETVDLVDAVRRLRLLGHERILCEGGPSLLSGLLARQLLDELCLTGAPILAGAGRQTLAGRADGDGDETAPINFELTDLAEGDGMLFAKYRPIHGVEGGAPSPSDTAIAGR
jgi:riboflavin biosynthesis pyrimidine reductase